VRTIYLLAAGNERGGAASHLATLCRVAHTHREAVDYRLVLLGSGPLADELVGTYGPTETITFLPTSFRAAVRSLGATLRTARPKSLLHAHGPRLNILARLATMRLKFPWTSTLHSHIYNDFLGSRVKTLLFPRLNVACLGATKGLFVVNPDFASLLPSKRCYYVPNAIETVTLPHDRTHYRKSLRKHLGIAESDFVCGVAARFDPVKDIATVIRALTFVRDLPIHLAIAGDGEQAAMLRQLVHQQELQNRVHFLGYIADVRTFYAGLDVHILASKSEGTPTTILEAGAVGVATIGSDIPAIQRLLQHGATGLGFALGDARSLADKLRDVYLHEHQLHACVQRFQTEVLPEFTAENMLRSYIAGYTEMMSQGD